MKSSDGTKRDSWKEVLAIESICDRFERTYRDRSSLDAPPRIEDFLGTHREPVRSRLLCQLLVIELDCRRQAEESPEPEEYAARFPADGDAVLAAFRTLDEPSSRRRLPRGYQLGVYIIRDLLGQGGMGAVYRAWDGSQQREVALKVIRADRLAGSSPVIRQRWAEQFSREALAASRLLHPAIVPLVDFGEIEGQPYLVMQLIEGSNLRELQAQERIPVRRAVEIILAIAEALDCLHQHELYHCDVKPSNILIDDNGQPYLSDFGLALDEEQIPAEPGLAGTAAYMSPEQARGEGHLIDGRTDIFSLAVVLYELLAGENPFDHPDRNKALELVREARVVPLRQHHPEIPEELDRICLRALSRLADDRYWTARDLADDLRAFLDAPGQGAEPTDQVAQVPPSRIDLKGIAAFGPEDARSYPSLVPGPRTRSGLPVHIATWLEGIAATVRRRAFRVGVIYGPSGSGKSSLVRAGILPRLPSHVVGVYIDGSQDVETTLREALQLRLSALDSRHLTDLTDLVSSARRCETWLAGASRRKLLLVIDHFEHWLHAHPQPGAAELTAALRQCDGVSVQCLLLVREEFRTPAARFLKELDLESSAAYKESLVDLFDRDHAWRVLVAMGRSSETLPAANEALTDEHRRFLDHAVHLLEHDGRVVPAQLAMFVEYIRDKPWTGEPLTMLGGVESMAVAFFDDMLRRAIGGPPSRRALNAVAAILRALLPAADRECQRPVRTAQELLGNFRSGRLDEFRPVLDSLCRQARVLTLVASPHVATPAPDANPGHSSSQHESEVCRMAGHGETGPRECRYQLAHDSLLPLVHAWLQLKQRESWWGRHAQRMAEHAATWDRRPRTAFLPPPRDWAAQLASDAVRYLRRSSTAKTPLHRRMMRAATVHYLRAAGLLVLLGGAIIAPLVWYADRRQRITQHTVTEILQADAERLPAIIREPPASSTAVRQRLFRELDAAVFDDASELAKDAAAGRRVNAATALCLTDPRIANLAWPLLADAPDPRVRTFLIHRLAAAKVDPQLLIQGYREERDPGVRQALLLALGQYSKDQLPTPLRESLFPTLQAGYRTDPDPGIHAAVDWLLRRWDRGKEVDEINRQLEAAGWNQTSDWYHTPAGHLMIVIRGPVEFEMGSPDKECGHQPNEVRRRVRIDRTFAIAATEVTEFQFHQAFGETFKPRDPAHPDVAYPANNLVFWHDALWYCHQLTEREGLSESGAQRVYIPEPTEGRPMITNFFGRVKCEHAPNALQRTGYRLPTEEEWEYACRAGTTTSRFFGETDLYMSSYAWTNDDPVQNTLPVALLMPNRFGLFDTLGNVSEWCHDIYGRDEHNWLLISLRGGSAWSSPVLVRSAIRLYKTYRHTTDRIGFRIARTLPVPSPAVKTNP